MLLRADSDSSVYSWTIDKSTAVGRFDSAPMLPKLYSSSHSSLRQLWKEAKPLGLLDQVVRHFRPFQLTGLLLFILSFFRVALSQAIRRIDNFRKDNSAAC